jgi:hypothetical protein
VARRVDPVVDFSARASDPAPLGVSALSGTAGWFSARWTGMLVPPANDAYTFRVRTAASPGLHHGVADCSSGNCSTSVLVLPTDAAEHDGVYVGADVWAAVLVAGISPCASSAASSSNAAECDPLVFCLGPAASDRNNAYVGMRLFVSDYDATADTAILQERIIIEYNGISRAATLSSPLSPPPSPVCTYLLLPDGAASASGVAGNGGTPGELVLSAGTPAPATDGAPVGLVVHIVTHDYFFGRRIPTQLAARIIAYTAANKTARLDLASLLPAANRSTYVVFGPPLGRATVSTYNAAARRLTLASPGLPLAVVPQSSSAAASRSARPAPPPLPPPPPSLLHF